MRKFAAVLFLTICMALIPAVSPGYAGEGTPERKLVILFTNDLHSYFLPERLPEAAGPGATQGGYAKLASLIDRYRNIYKDKTLLLDGGDFSMGTLFHSAFASHALELRLMARMGYEVTTPGNHEFDFHPDGLARSLREARKEGVGLPAIVATNVTFRPIPDDRDKALREAFKEYPLREYTVIERNGLRIGIFGILGKDAQSDSPFASPVVFTDPILTAARIVDILKVKERVDMIVCLSHSGTWTDKRLSEDEILARKVPNIDVIISGHTHTVLPKPIVVGKTIIVSSGCYGKYLGVLETAHREDQTARLLSYTLIPVTEKIPDRDDINRLIHSFKADVDREYLAPYGTSFDQPLAYCPFDMETFEYSHDHPGETGLGDLITDAYRYAVEKAEGNRYDYVHVVIQPLGNIRSSLLKGPVTTADLFRVLSLGLGTDDTPGYPLLTTYLTGKDLKKLLEVETTVSHMKDDAHLQISGVRFTFNPRRIPFDRVTSVSVGDRDGTYAPVNPAKLYRIAMNHYAAMMVQYVEKVSYGLLTFTPRDRQGLPMADIKAGIVPAGALIPGATQIKEWAALAAYVRSFPDRDGNGLPDIPDRYRGPERRIVAQPSWNPVALVAGGGFITYGALALLLVVALILCLVAWSVTRFVKKMKRA